MQKKKVTVNKKKLPKILGGVFLLFLIVLIIALLILSKNKDYTPYYKIEERSEQIKETVISDNQAYAWLRVQGTNIDTPIIPRLYSLDDNINDDYLWTSPKYIEGENRKVIYGHNLRNVSSNPDKVAPNQMRFEQLVSFVYEDFAKENLYVQYNDGTEEALYKIYAVTFNDESDEYGQSYKKEDLTDYIKDVRANSIYDYDVKVNKNDELISLVTCTRYFGAYEKTQFKVDARKVRKNEKITKYNVETNANYDIIKKG